MSFLQLHDVDVFFPVTKGIFRKVTDYVKAVRNVSFEMEQGRVMSIIGESGSGKTTLGNAILGLYAPTSGNITYQEKDIADIWFTGEIQAVFQNPFSSLNPRLNVLNIVSEPLKNMNKNISRKEISEKVAESLEMVGIDRESMYRYPHEFSGGQRQRISIARALISDPQLLVLDEPVSSLDVSIRAQILNLLAELKEKKGLSYIYISHDLATVRFLSQEVLIIYKGRMMEKGDVDSIFTHPTHPYTDLLFHSARDIIIPIETEEEKKENIQGCPFFHRCSKKTDICKEQLPIEHKVEKNHAVFCHNWED